MLFPRHQSAQPPNRVAVTGVGIITALGRGWAVNGLGLRAGRVAIRPVQHFDVSHQRVRVAGEMSLPSPVAPPGLPPRRAARLDRAAQALLCAACDAWDQAGWDARSCSDTGLVLGTTSAGMLHGQAYYDQMAARPDSRRHQPARVLNYQAQRQALDLAESLSLSGPVDLVSNACASGANALGHAWDLVRRGRAERVFAGGYEALCRMVFAGFDSLQALSPTVCRPFDRQHDGLVLGEGAAVFALERWETARRRGANILGEIAGYGAATDIHHITQPHPAGDAAYAAMVGACARAQVRPDEIGYLNAHGTGTRLNDESEAAAINRWAGTHAPSLAVSSTKAGIGHLLGAAGAVEAAICLMALEGQWLPPIATLEDPDPACRFDLVRQPRDARFELAMSNSFGFGGANASLIFRKAP